MSDLAKNAAGDAAINPGVTGAEIVAAAESWLGVTYTYGGGRGTAAQARADGVDCSGLVYQVFSALGYPDIGTDTVSQFNNPDATTVASLADAQPGDLVFFGQPTGGTNEHVGIYIGNDLMIDAPHTGASVRLDPVSTFGETILGIKRITGVATSATDTSAISSSGLPASIGTSITRLLVEAVAVAGALGLAVLGVYAATRNQKAPPT